MSLSVDIITALKRCLRARAMTYRDLAAQLRVSEAAVKRMFSRRAMSLMRLEQICTVLGLNLAELGSEADRARPVLEQLSVAQEQALVDAPALLLALFLTLNRWQQDDVLAEFSFTLPQWTGLLVRLDRLGIIELLPGNRGRALTARNFRWRADGPVERYFRHTLLGDYFAQPFDGPHDALLLLSGSLSVQGSELFRQRLRDVAREFDSLLARDAGLPVQERHGLILVLAQKPWDLPAFAPWRRHASSVSPSCTSPSSSA